jgi:hypothetical protein
MGARAKILAALGVLAAVVLGIVLLDVTGSSKDESPTSTQARRSSTAAPRAGGAQRAEATPRPPKALERGEPGWSMNPGAYVGRYRMVASSDPRIASTGQLTLFMRPVREPKPATLPSGILDYTGADETNVLYLTKFSHLRRQNVAEVNAGNFGYAPVGALRVVDFDAGREQITVAVTAARGLRLNMRFARFSKSSHP